MAGSSSSSSSSAEESLPRRSNFPAIHPAMSDSIPAGSYLIRHVPTGHVLFDAGNNKLKAEKRDEGNPLYREAQVWWIEPIPEQQKFFDKAPTLYTITQLAQEKSLDAPDKKHLHLHKSHGAPWQLWKFERREDCKEWYVHTPTTHVVSPASLDVPELNDSGKRVFQHRQYVLGSRDRQGEFEQRL